MTTAVQDATSMVVSPIGHLGYLGVLARVSGASDCTLGRLALSFSGGDGLATDHPGTYILDSSARSVTSKSTCSSSWP